VGNVLLLLVFSIRLSSTTVFGSARYNEKLDTTDHRFNPIDY
jgi:hypothetical protein